MPQDIEPDDDYEVSSYDELNDDSYLDYLDDDMALAEWIDIQEERELELDLIDDLNDERVEKGLERIPYDETPEERLARVKRDEAVEAERWAGQDRHGEHSSTYLGAIFIEAQRRISGVL